MSQPRKAVNPFYPLLVVVGVVFALTACAYGMMAVFRLRPDRVEQVSGAGLELLEFLDRRGAVTMAVELVILAVASIAAMATDSFWTRRATARHAVTHPRVARDIVGTEDREQPDPGGRESFSTDDST